MAAGSDVDPTASATTVEQRDRPRAIETLDEVLLEVPGARRRRTGGFGGFTALSLRGAESEHTTVLLGEVPLTTADGSAFDLSTVPPWLFDRVEVYRGGAPLWLGTGAIGGVLRLVPRTARGTRAEAAGGAGSFDLALGRAAVGVEGRDIGWLATAGLTHYGGRFPFRADRFPLEPGETDLVQTNAHLLEASGLGHARMRVAGGTLSVIGLGLERIGGLPPPATRWTDLSLARRSHTRGVIALAGEWLEGDRPPAQADLAGWRVQVVGSIGLDRRRLSDPTAAYGQVPRATDERVFRVSLRAAGTLRVLEWLDATMIALGWHEEFDPRDALASHALVASHRDGGVIGLEARMHGREGRTRWEVRPSARIEVVDARIAAIRLEHAGDITSATQALPTVRLGGAIELTPGITIQLSAATGTRAPGAIELFGDGGLLAGDTHLRPETSWTVDGGVVARGRAGPIQGIGELRAFGLRMSDLIRYVRTPTNQVAPENVASAWVAGLEASARVELDRHASLVGAFTWIEHRDETLGRMLPFRPRTTAYLRPALHLPDLSPLDRATAWFDVDWSDVAFDDRENARAIPAVARVGVGVSLEGFERRVRVDLSVRDVFDARGRDFLQRPLPGRSVALQLALRTD
jgi:outer membrane receptor protein involved in Fe transport